jgi:uncharacterized protein YbbC (DUF1343 family)
MRRSHFLGAAAALAASRALPARAETLPHANVTLGDDVLLHDVWPQLADRTVGIITNQTGVTSRLESVVDAVHRGTELHVKAVFAPEHGFRGDRAAGASVGTYTDLQTGLPVYSLYGATRHPSAAMLDGIDVLLFDIQDVGARAYTFVSTMAYAMQSAAAHGKEFWVLDRPNPVGGKLVEGPVLEPAYESFIGLYPIAMRHGMTVGELATLFNDRFGIGSKLHVVKMRGWDRSQIWPDTGLQWVQTSPNVPTWQTCFVLLCTGLIDNAGVNNGTGYSKPFFYAGGADIDGSRLARTLNARDLPGVWFRPAAWSPFAGFWKDRELSGVELDVFDERRFAAVPTAVEILTAVRDLFPSALHVKATELAHDWGTDSLRRGLLEGKSAGEIVEGWSAALDRFKTIREKYLLY